MEDLKRLAEGFSATQSKIAAKLLGAEVIFTPEETWKIAVEANIPSVPDGILWRPGLNLSDGTFVIWNGYRYLTIQGHISQLGWEPDREDIDALFVLKTISDGYEEWSQPGGDYDAYAKGDKVTYQGKIYVSEVNANVYAPGIVPGQWTETK